MHLIRKLKSFKVALFAGLTGLVLTTCMAGVDNLPRTRAVSDTATEGLDIVTTEAPGAKLSSRDELANKPPKPRPAPATDKATAPVEPAGQPTGQVESAPIDTSSTQQFGKVTVKQPRLRVIGIADNEMIRKIRRLPGVTYVSAFEVGQIPVGERQKTVTVAAVNPKFFRPMTPQVTADAVAVWERIVEGDAAFTHDTGNRLKAELGSFVPAGTEGFTLRVGAYASNGIPPVADALVSPQKAAELNMATRRDLLIAIKDGVDAAGLLTKVRQIARTNVEMIEQPQARRAFLTGADARSEFEPYTYIDMQDGMIQIDPAWVQRNIVRRPMPLLKGEVVCHRLMVDQLYGALKEIEDRGWGHLIDPSQYGGCWVPRHIDFNPAKPLSMHSWGLAADFNVSTNGLGMKPQMDPRVVQVFDRWGFVWGGRWSRPDGMHFELGALIQNSPQG